jgi:hypothetical protein
MTYLFTHFENLGDIDGTSQYQYPTNLANESS